MYNLINWQGKTEDMNISYEIGDSCNALISSGIDAVNLPAIYTGQFDNVCDVVEESWDRNVNKADRIDYLIAVACGIITGLIDSFWVGEFSLERANTWGDKKIEEFVIKVAKLDGYTKNDLGGAIKYLEGKHHLASDGNTNDFGGACQHHLRDFTHHFSIAGLICSLFTQFSGKVIGTETSGIIKIVEIKNKDYIGENFEEKILNGTMGWFLHMVSDMDGSSETAGKGTGIPGPFLSLMKEMSALPFFKNLKFNNTQVSTLISKLFNGTLLAKKDENGKIKEPVKFDLRTEIGMMHELTRQMVPIIINECLVRGMYFVRRLYIAIKEMEINSFSDLKRIKPSDILPFNNRIISRMITVASGTFTVIDTVDAMIRAAVKARGINVDMVIGFAARVNYVGIGRFILACKTDLNYVMDNTKESSARDAATSKRESEYEKKIADLKCLSLDYNQMKVLYSLERLILSDDIANTDNTDERTLKQRWTLLWEKQLLDSMPLLEEDKLHFFMTEDEIVNHLIMHNRDEMWMYLVAMEAVLFCPYIQLDADSTDKGFKKLKCKSKYLTDKFAKLQSYLSKKEFTDLIRSYKSAYGTISGNTKSMVIRGVGTVAFVVASGGFAFAFAPAIAVALAGDATLHGAALVSYSLAAVGGGSLAAGGLGMAGGTAIITGGGALVGLLGGAGVSSVSTINLLNQDSYVLSECSKLLTFSKLILINKVGDVDKVAYIESQISVQIVNIENQLNSFKEENEKNKELKKKIQVAEKSLKYLKRCDAALKKLIKSPECDLAELMVVTE